MPPTKSRVTRKPTPARKAPAATAMKPHGNGTGHEAGPKCGGKTRAGGACKNAAGFKTAHPGIGRCAFHGGATPSHERSAQTELARRACNELAIPVEGITPEQGLLDAFQRAHAAVVFYAERVGNLPVDPEPDEFVVDENGDGKWKRGGPGLWARTFHISGVPTGEAKPHIWVQLYHEALDREVRIAKAIVELKIDARQLQLAEREGAVLFGAIERAYAKLGLPDFDRFRATLADELHALNSTGALPAG